MNAEGLGRQGWVYDYMRCLWEYWQDGQLMQVVADEYLAAQDRPARDVLQGAGQEAEARRDHSSDVEHGNLDTCRPPR